MTHSHTTPYHHMSNGQCECMNKTITGMQHTLEESHKSHWKDHLTKMTHVYNCTKNSSTGYSPYYITFRHKLCLPIDALLETEDIFAKTHKQFINEWQTAMKDTYHIARELSDQHKVSDVKEETKGTIHSLKSRGQSLIAEFNPSRRVRKAPCILGGIYLRGGINCW